MNKIYRCLFFILCLTSTQSLKATSFVMADLYGQLGNQMFQIATAVSLALDNDAEPLFPDLLTKKTYGIPTNYKEVFSRFHTTNETYRKKTQVTLNYYEPSYRYAPIPYQHNIHIHGYFQSWKYFDHNKAAIVKIFSPSRSILKYLTKKYEDIINDPNTVSIHIRSYRKEDPSQTIYPFNGVDFVKEAMQHFPEDTHYIVFSNDIKWCKENLNNLAPSIRFIEGESHLNDFYLQSLCKNNIISNSSFSWWAAYLNKNENKKVIVPGHWFQPESGLSIEDLNPPEWIVLTDYCDESY